MSRPNRIRIFDKDGAQRPDIVLWTNIWTQEAAREEALNELRYCPGGMAKIVDTEGHITETIRPGG